MAHVLGLNEAIAAGAIICGAYFGDKMTPLSETTILVPKLVGRGLTVNQHVRNMFWTAGPAIAQPDLLLPRAERRTERRSGPRPGAGGPRAAFWISPLNLLPLAC